MVPTNTFSSGISSIAKTTSLGGGKARKSCGYHHQRHEACSPSCEGKRTHPQSPHALIYNKFTEGCPFCLLTMFQQITKNPAGNNNSSQTLPNEQPLRDQQSPPNTNTNTDRKRKTMMEEEEEAKVLEMNAKIEQLKKQQEKEKASLELQQRILEYQRQQQLIEATRIQQYQLKLEEAKTQQENLRQHLLNSSDFLSQTAKTSIINNTSLTDFPKVNIPISPFLAEITTNDQIEDTLTNNNESEHNDNDNNNDNTIQSTIKSPRVLSNSNPPPAQTQTQSIQTTQQSNQKSSISYKPLSIQLLINDDHEKSS